MMKLIGTVFNKSKPQLLSCPHIQRGRLRWKSCLSIRTNEENWEQLWKRSWWGTGWEQGRVLQAGMGGGVQGGGLWVAAGLRQSPGETGQEDFGRGLFVCPACVALNPQERQTLLNKPGFLRALSSPSSVWHWANAPTFFEPYSYLYSGSWYLSNGTAAVEKNRWTTSRVPSPGSGTAVSSAEMATSASPSPDTEQQAGGSQRRPPAQPVQAVPEPSWLLLIMYSYFRKSLPS